MVPKAGTFKQERDENWVTSHFGDWGLEKNDSRKIARGDVKTVIIGDSYIEANMIPPEQRMQHWVGDDAIGIGFSGFDFDDYLEILPKYLKYAPNCHKLFVYNMFYYSKSEPFSVVAEIGTISKKSMVEKREKRVY